MYTFVCYDRCGTCRKAEKFLQEHQIEYVKRPIKEEKPTVEELKEWQAASGRELRKFFNTSGQLYRSMNIKEQLKSLSDEEIFNLLASDGMLVKRPVLVGNGMVLVGFNEGEWSEKLL
jgi:arsenate reductase